jgi:NitT/TauT family transport system permease protein
VSIDSLKADDVAIAGEAPADEYEVRGRPWLDKPSSAWILRVTALVSIIGLWQWYASGVSKALFATPSDIAISLYQLTFVENEMLVPVLQSLSTMVVGLVAVIVISVPFGLLMGRSKYAEWALDPYVTFLYVLPSISFIPLLVVWLGFGFQLRIVLVIISGVFPMIINTVAGVHNVDSELLDTGRSFTASESQIVRTIVVPASLPFMFAGLRIAFASAWVGVIVAEMTASLTGVGGMILVFAHKFQTANMFVPIIFIMMVGISIQAVFNVLQKRLTPWQQETAEI